jgi:hypothetical protein
VREMARFLLVTVLGVFVTLGTVPGAGAQLPPVDDVTDPLEEAVEDTVEAVETTVGTSTGTVGGAGGGETGVVGGTGGGETDAVQETTEDATGSVTSSATESASGTGATSGSVSGGDAGGSSSGTADRPRERGHAGPRSQRAPNEGRAREPSARVAATRQKFSSTVATFVPLLVELTNDANRDGSYSDIEAAPVPDGDVLFQVRLENNGSNELAILAIRNASAVGRGGDAACGDLAGIRLAPGESTACRFTMTSFAPPKGERAVTVFEVDAADMADPSTTGTVTDTTVVRTENASVLGFFVRRGLDFLATTGARIPLLLAATMVLAVSGALLITMGNRRRALQRATVRSTAQKGADAGPRLAFRGPHHQRSRPSLPLRSASRSAPDESADRRSPQAHRPARGISSPA